ncbi:hypothetical protein M8C21_018813, partial [Ambrosia artemisiifolia]
LLATKQESRRETTNKPAGTSIDDDKDDDDDEKMDSDLDSEQFTPAKRSFFSLPNAYLAVVSRLVDF